MIAEPVGGKIGWLIAALFLLCLAGCSFDPEVPERGRDSAWIKITYVDQPVSNTGNKVDGLVECLRPGVCKVTLRADQYPFGCLNHEIVHVFSKEFHFHAPEKPSGAYCLN